MIKVIEVSSDTNIGGAGNCLLTLLRELDRSKFEVKAVIPYNSLLKAPITELGTEVIEADGIADKSLGSDAIKELLKIFKREKPDIVHAHASMSARIAAKRAGAKVVYTRHSVFDPSPRLSKGLGKLINGAVNNHYADGIIAVAEAAKDNLTATGVSEKKIRVILNGVYPLKKSDEAEKKKIRQRFGIKDGERVVSIVARLEEVKGHEYFIEAAQRLINKGLEAKFVIAGTGSRGDYLKKLARDKGLEESVIFTGFISDVDKLMNITDVQVNASYGTEATSLALLEGMSIGVPAVVSDFGGNPGVIKNGVNGFIVPKKNAEALADGIERLINDAELYDRLSRGAVEIFNSSFTAEAMTRQTEEVYERVLK